MTTATRRRTRYCVDCDKPLSRIRPAPMLRDEVWATIARPDEFLCDSCCDARFAAKGRTLVMADGTALIPWLRMSLREREARRKYDQAMAEKRAAKGTAAASRRPYRIIRGKF